MSLGKSPYQIIIINTLKCVKDQSNGLVATKCFGHLDTNINFCWDPKICNHFGAQLRESLSAEKSFKA